MLSIFSNLDGTKFVTLNRKKIASIAAKRLTPVILELGGKSPCIVDCKLSDIDVVARRIAWAGLILNAGQSCVRPDYIMCKEEIGDILIDKIKHYVETMMSNDYPTIINHKRFKCLNDMIQSESHRSNALWRSNESSFPTMYPTIVNYKNDWDGFISSELMKDEIFGPILPIVYWK